MPIPINRTNNPRTCLYCGRRELGPDQFFCASGCAIGFAIDAANAGHRLPLVDDQGRIHYTITREDVNRASIEAFGRKWSVTDFMGRIYPNDAGKRIYLTKNNAKDHKYLQVESADQRDRRLADGK